MRAFIEEHSQIEKEWFKNSNYICFLAVSSELELDTLLQKAQKMSILCSIFKEPDMNNSLTAITFEPGKKTKKLLSKIKLALK
jgi:siroheme synthase (precorrin-2 oxidase/ferrochelatase)